MHLILNSETAESIGADGQSNAKAEICQVCGYPGAIAYRRTRHDGLTAICVACKKFFRRNCSKNPETLRCKFTAPKSTLKGSVKQLCGSKLCSKCRLLKCFEVGLGHRSFHSPTTEDDKQQESMAAAVQHFQGRSSHSSGTSGYSSSDSSLVFVPSSPPSRDYTGAENILRNVIPAIFEFDQEVLMLPLRRNQVLFRDEYEGWHLTMENFDYLSRMFKTLVKAFPGYEELHLEEKCKMYADSLLQISLGLMNRNQAFPAIMHPNNYEQMCVFFPEFRQKIPETHQLCRLMGEWWNPSPAELCCLIVTLFYQGTTYTGRIAGMQMALGGSVMRQCGNDPSKFQERLDSLFKVVEALNSISDRRRTAIQTIGRRRPDIVGMGALYSAVINNKKNVMNDSSSMLN